MRFVGMTECGTHTVCFAEHGPFKEGSLTMAQAVMDRADKSMIVTADRGFSAYEFWHGGEDFATQIALRGHHPPKHMQSWLDSLLYEMASRRSVKSRGKRNVRGVRKRTSNYGARNRGDPLNLPCDPKPKVLII